MSSAFKHAIKKHMERQAQLSAEKDDQGGHEAQTTGSRESDAAAGINAAVDTPETEAKEAEVMEKKKAELSPEKATGKKLWRTCRWNLMVCFFGPFALRRDLSPEEAVEKKRWRSYRWKLVIGLFFPSALQALDTTIIASAFPYIATDFKEIKQINWIISAFNLTSAAFLPFWAQITDIFGRHLTIQAAMIVLMVGSAISTGAPTSAFGVLLLGRALQGVGAAGVNICISAILADQVSLSDYALNWTKFTMVSGISFMIGPIVGGYLTQASWRWCFAIILPIGVVAILLVLFLLREELLGPQPLQQLEGRPRDTSTLHGRVFARLATIDYGGQMLFLWGLGLLSVALTWGGGTYSWNSAAVLAPLIIGGVLSIGWILYEHSMSPGFLMSRIFPYQRAMMPWDLLSQREIGLLFLINFTVGMSMFAVLYFMDLYFALVEGRSSSKAGVALLYYLPGLVYTAGALTVMFSSNVWPRQTLPPLLLGGITSAVGITVLGWAVHAEKTHVIYGMMTLVGYGADMRMTPSSLHALAYFPTMTASIQCLLSFATPFGGLVGLTIMSTVFTNRSGVGQQDPVDGIMWAFIAITPIMWLSVLLTTSLGNVWILTDGGHEVVNGAYVWSFITRKKLTREQITRGDGLGKLVPVGAKKKDGNDVEAGLRQSAKTPVHNDEAQNIETAPA